jgi:hypothetical protein
MRKFYWRRGSSPLRQLYVLRPAQQSDHILIAVAGPMTGQYSPSAADAQRGRTGG